MAVDFMGYRNTSSNSSFSAELEENALQEAASGLESVEKLIRLLSQTQQNQHQEKYPLTAMDMDCKAVADVAVSKFKKVISLLGRTRTGHARFRRAPLTLTSGSSFQPQRFHNQVALDHLHGSDSLHRQRHLLGVARQCSHVLSYVFQSGAC
ncbi:probable WRKY transcription factor 11 [Pyrus x bretschneideri]|uniref:probable WRKY transcription factor 11 n=1 Tax=Pyrus x bretschneideri TaxID=225117 RepID=UPI00202DB86D|nr:probable WRKY transcription factor 11 [Pyrus x bretschneideri]